MIYLFEDRIERKKQYVSDYTIENPLIKEKYIDCKAVAELKDYIRTEFCDAKVVLLHKSYDFDNKEFTIENVIQSFKSVLNVPVILFSGGSRSNLIKEGDMITAEINSGVMYNNLNAFVRTYQSEKKIIIPILVYGDNYRINSLLEMQSKINAYLFDRKDDDKISVSDTNRYFKRLFRLFTSVNTDYEMSVDIMKIQDWMDAKIGTIAISTFNSQIQKLINKYRI